MLAVLAIATLAWSGMLSAQAARRVTDPGEGRNALRVMTYSIHHGAGNEECAPREAGSAPAADCGLNLERIAKVISAAKADIVGLQEVDRFWARSGGVDQPRVLAQMLAMSVCFGPNLQLPAEGNIGSPREYGTAILSRFPLRDCRNTHLPRVSEANEQRGLLSGEVETPNGNVRVMVTHLSVVAADRVPQTEELAKAVATSQLPTILMGDLNHGRKRNRCALFWRRCGIFGRLPGRETASRRQPILSALRAAASTTFWSRPESERTVPEF